MLTRKEKEEIVKDLAERLKRKKIAIFSDFHGISVAKSQALRRTLKKNDAEYKVAKKTLIDRAIEKTGTPIKTKELHGEVGVTFGYGDEVLPAKTLVKFEKENETFKILGGMLGEKVLTAKDVFALSKLPNRDVLLGHVVGALAGPIRNLATVLQGNIKNLVVVLNKIAARST